MKLILFTKIFAGSSTKEVGATASRFGFDGLDLAVREGQCIEPQNARKNLPAAIKMWRDMGLSVPMLTLEGDFTNPAADGVEAIYEACAENSIPFVKLGYWRWKPHPEYWSGVAGAKRDLEGFQNIGENHDVCSLFHTHAGMNGCNVSGAMHMLLGLEPRYVAAYIDPAHQAIEGEGMAMSLAIAGDYLKMVGVKNARYTRTDKDGRSIWQPEWCLLEEGLVDWPEAISLLKAAGYANPLSFHATYSAFRDKEGALQQMERDLQYLRPLLV